MYVNPSLPIHPTLFFPRCSYVCSLHPCLYFWTDSSFNNKNGDCVDALIALGISLLSTKPPSTRPSSEAEHFQPCWESPLPFNALSWLPVPGLALRTVPGWLLSLIIAPIATQFPLVLHQGCAPPTKKSPSFQEEVVSGATQLLFCLGNLVTEMESAISGLSQFLQIWIERNWKHLMKRTSGIPCLWSIPAGWGLPLPFGKAHRSPGFIL